MSLLAVLFQYFQDLALGVVRDDRGQKHRVRFYADSLTTVTIREEIARLSTKADKLRRMSRSRRDRLRMYAPLTLIGVAVIIASGWLTYAVSRSGVLEFLVQRIMGVVLVLGFSACGVVVIWVSYNESRVPALRSRTAETLLQLRYLKWLKSQQAVWCAACGCRMEGVPRDEDGFALCPVCGAAWDFGAMDR